MIEALRPLDFFDERLNDVGIIRRSCDRVARILALVDMRSAGPVEESWDVVAGG